MRLRHFAFILWIGLLAGGIIPAGAQTANGMEKVLIRASKPYGHLVARIQAAGGRVTHEYRHVDAVAAEVPLAALQSIASAAGPGAVSKDVIIAAPEPVDTVRGRLPGGQEPLVAAGEAQPLSASDITALASAQPAAYLINNGIINASPLHATGITGEGVVVAVIDSGIRPGFPHIELDGSVVGCDDFVGDALGCSHIDNGGHGTFVAGMISANVIFTFGDGNPLRLSALTHCPACFANPPTNTQLPMIGTAPLSSIYALRVFGPTGGSPTSRILAAIDRVIDLRSTYDAGQPGGSNIGIVNFSLGGATLFAGRDLFDRAVGAMLARDILPVVATGNTGPATITTASPGTAVGTLSVGAASLPHNERILRDLQFGLGIGALYRPFLGTQMAYFSGRGPNADGRVTPDVVANGFASYGQGFATPPGGISIGSGTSFATPSVTGVAALLRQAFPSATARQIRNAIIQSANPNLIHDGSIGVDRGAGYVDALAARNLLSSGAVPDSAPTWPKTTKQVQVNVQQGSPLRVRNGLVSESIRGLKPGQRHDILYSVRPNVKQVVVTLTNVTPALPPAQQNAFFGDDILLAIHSAKTSAIGGAGDYPVFTFTTGGTFAVDAPEEGIMRISVSGDWTNAGEISARVAVFSTTEPVPGFTSQGRIAEGGLVAVPFSVKAGAKLAQLRLEWREGWGSYPANDLDLILVRPDGSLSFAGATLRNPELVNISNPIAGQWVALIEGFEVNSGEDRYEFRALVDGKVVR